MAQIPKGRWVEGPYQPIVGTVPCTFSITVVKAQMMRLFSGQLSWQLCHDRNDFLQSYLCMMQKTRRINASSAVCVGSFTPTVTTTNAYVYIYLYIHMIFFSSELSSSAPRIEYEWIWYATVVSATLHCRQFCHHWNQQQLVLRCPRKLGSKVRISGL